MKKPAIKIDKEILRKARIQFQILVDRCCCSQKALYGKCFPNKCFPDLYKILYPKGGYYCRNNYKEERK